MWITPKVDWKPDDYFTLQDWKRIVNNLVFLRTLSEGEFPIKDVTLENSMSLPFYDIVNNMEDNLEALSKSYPQLSKPFEKVTWTYRTSPSYQRNPSYEDFNRWEQFLRRFHNEYTRVLMALNVIKSGTATASSNRLRQYFGRSVK